MFSPNLVWQWQRGFPTLELLGNVAEGGKNVVLAPVDLVLQQVLLHHPMLLPFWIAGSVSLLFGSTRRFRVLGRTFVVFFLASLALNAKSYYLAPIYPMLFAAGGVAAERRLSRFGRRPRFAVVGWIFLAGAVILPAMLPYRDPAGLLLVFHGLPPDVRETTGILAINHGEAGALDLYGPSRGLPAPIWLCREPRGSFAENRDRLKHWN